MTTRQLRVEDFYETVTTEEITTLGDISFTVTKAPVNTRGFIIIEPTSSSKREKLPYYNVVGTKIYVKGVNRTYPKTHAIGAVVQINDTANIFNYLSENLSTTFYIEKTGALTINVWGGPILKENVEMEVLDTEIVLGNNKTTYICYNYNTNDITGEDTAQHVVTAVVTTASGVITSILYKNYKFSINGIKSAYDVAVDNGFQGTEAEWLLTLVGPAGDIAQAPAGVPQTIIDNNVIDGTTVTTDNATYIKVTLANGDYTNYTLTSIITADISQNVYSNETVIGTFGATGITYSNGNIVNKVTGVTSFSGQVMYKNQANDITGTNTFNNVTIFKGQVSFKYHVNATGVDLFDADLGGKQGFNFDSGNVTLDFENLLDGCTYLFAITINTSTVSLGIGTVKRKGALYVYNAYSIGGETYPIDLEVGTHLFVCESFSEGAHFNYVGKSTLIS